MKYIVQISQSLVIKLQSWLKLKMWVFVAVAASFVASARQAAAFYTAPAALAPARSAVAASPAASSPAAPAAWAVRPRVLGGRKGR